MKTSILILSAAFALSVTNTFAQDIPQSKVPSLVVNNFQQTFPKASDVEWEMKGDLFKVEFETGLTRVDNDAWYDKSGKLVKHEEEISNSDLPQKVVSTINSEFSGYRMDDAKKITTEGKVTYTLELKKLTEEWKVEFDVEGKLLSKVAD